MGIQREMAAAAVPAVVPAIFFYVTTLSAGVVGTALTGAAFTTLPLPAGWSWPLGRAVTIALATEARAEVEVSEATRAEPTDTAEMAAASSTTLRLKF